MSYRFKLAIVALSLMLSACSRIVVEPVKIPGPSEDKKKGVGVFYALPKTVIRTQVDVQKTTYSKGKYVQFAPLFAPGHRPVCKDTADCKAKKRFWLKQATLTSYGQPDADEIYMVKFAGGGAVDQSLAMTWTEAGLPVTATATVTNRTTDFVLSGVKLAAGIVQRVGAGASLMEVSATGDFICQETLAGDKWILDLIKKVLGSPDGVLVAQNYCALKATGAGKVGGSGTSLSGTDTRFLTFLRSGDEIRVTPSVTTCSNAALSGSTTDSTGYAAGANTVTLAPAGTGALLKGQSFTFSGDPQVYVVTSGDPNVSDGGTISFEPGLKVALPKSPKNLTLLDACTYDRDCVHPGTCLGVVPQDLTVQSIQSDTSLTVSGISPAIPPGASYVLVGKGPRTRLDEDRDRNDLEDALRAYQARVLPLLRGRAKLVGVDQIFAEDAGAYLDRIDAMISKELAALFVGSKKAKTVWTGTLDVAPTAAGTTPFLRINPAKGVCAQASLAPISKSIPKDITLTGADCTSAHGVQLKVDYHPPKATQMFDVVEQSIKDPEGKLSFRYRIPAQVSAKVEDTTAIKHPELIPGQKTPSQEVYGSAVLSVAQLGHIAALPAKRNSKSMSYELGFIEATGGLKSFKLSSTGALDAATLDSLGTTVNSFLDARATAEAAEAAKTDELAVLQRRAAILKAQSDICAALATFGLPCDVEPELPD